MTEFTDKLTKDQAIDRQNGILERALQAIDKLLVKINAEYGIEWTAGDEFPKDFLELGDRDLEKVFRGLWNVREEICGNRAFMEIEDQETQGEPPTEEMLEIDRILSRNIPGVGLPRLPIDRPLSP